MTREQMIDHIKAELLDISLARQYSQENDERYYERRARGLLDMIEGFGMSPPLVNVSMSRKEFDMFIQWTVQKRTWE